MYKKHTRIDKNLEKCILKGNKWIVCKKKKKKRKKITNKNKRKKSGDNQRKKPCEGKKKQNKCQLWREMTWKISNVKKTKTCEI